MIAPAVRAMQPTIFERLWTQSIEIEKQEGAATFRHCWSARRRYCYAELEKCDLRKGLHLLTL